MTPNDDLSPPEAELGIKSVDLGFLPFVGSGLLAWFAKKFLNLPDYTLAKPNPVHALAVLQRCLGREPIDALQISAALWQGKGNRSDWEALDGGRIVIFEDSVKGFISGQESSRLLEALGLNINLKLIGVSNNSIKLHALKQMTTHNIENINDIHWESIFL
jgi:hypothetical protein